VRELLSIVVPVFNEEATVDAVVKRLLAIDLPVAREILVINDGSTDGTRGVLDALPVVGETLRIVHAPSNGGKGSAIRTGFEQARGTIVAIQDADLELDPAELGELVAPILNRESQAVYGSRFLRGSQGAPLKTVLANRFLTGLTNVLYGSNLTDMETCYKIMRVDVARARPAVQSL
jgi:glycosyltransferase involved in cell wall biosynthesis